MYFLGCRLISQFLMSASAVRLVILATSCHSLALRYAKTVIAASRYKPPVFQSCMGTSPFLGAEFHVACASQRQYSLIFRRPP
jgi:hypothetical protein